MRRPKPTKTASLRAMFARSNAATRAPVAAERTTSDRPQPGEEGPVAQRSEMTDLDRDRPRCSGDPLPTARWPRLCHDLRTPLNAILGNTELLLDGSAGPLSSQARACIGDIQTAGSRMMRQVQALLELCRIRAVPASAAAVDLDLLVRLRAAHAAAPRSIPGMQMTPAGARLVVRGDPVWLDTLAATLIELHPGEDQNGAPSLVSLESRALPGRRRHAATFLGRFPTRPSGSAASCLDRRYFGLT